jgi:cytochrome c oxidase subunit 1
MIFFMAMAALQGGFGNWFVPPLILSPDMAFPRLNGIGFCSLPPSLLLQIVGGLGGSGPHTGWTIYPPLATHG